MVRQGLEYDRGFNDDQWYDGPQNYQDARECHGESSYSHNDRRYFDENINFGSFRRNSSPPRNVREAWNYCFISQMLGVSTFKKTALDRPVCF